MRGASTRRTHSSGAAARVDRARQQVEAKADDLAELEDDLAGRLLELDERWTARADAVEPVEVGLEKADITVHDLRLVWLPVP